MLADASVARNFAVVGWIDHLVALAGGTLSIAHGVMGRGPDEPGEIERILAAFEQESARSPGSRAGSEAMAAVVGLEDLIRRRSHDVKVLQPSDVEFKLALRLQDPMERAWRQELGIRPRRLDSGEAVSAAIAALRGLAFATDDEAGRQAYLGLGGTSHCWTLDLVKKAVARGLLDEVEARAGYQRLCERYRFWGAPWS